MSEISNVVAIVGSLRADSLNRAVFEAAVELMPGGVGLVELPLADLPLYNGDVEAAGDPASVVELKSGVDGADGLIIFTPEYNRGVPAVTKNAVDWLSRMPRQSPLSRAAVGIVAASPGGYECAGVRAHLGDSVGANTKRFFEQTIGFGRITDLISEGSLTDAETRDQLRSWLIAFIEHAGSTAQ